MTLFDSEFLGAWDLIDETGKGKDYRVTITHVEGANLMTTGGKTSKKPVLTLRGAKKKWALNKTNANAIANIHGRDVRQWVGKMVTIYPTTTNVGKQRGVPCIRVRPTAPSAGARGDEIPERAVDPEMRKQQDEAFGREQSGREPGED